MWNKAIVVNVWKGKTNDSINQECVLCGDAKESIPNMGIILSMIYHYTKSWHP